MITGYYYLHTNGELIFKRYLDDEQVADFRESDFVRMFWPVDMSYRGDAWTVLVEGLALGANKARVMELAEKWGCGDEDAINFAESVGARITKGSSGRFFASSKNMPIDNFEALEKDGLSKIYGVGNTSLEALAGLCNALGYKAQKMWGVSFKDLLKK